MFNNQRLIKKLDKSNVRGSIYGLPQQLAEAYSYSKDQKLPADLKNYNQIVFCGMGGSNLASEMLRDVFGADFKVPFILVRSYNLPNFISKDSLVIISSYSGNTIETLTCLKQALKVRAKIIIISAGGELEKIAQKYRLPYFKLDKKLNPSGQPRYSLGLQLGTILGIFENLKLIKINFSDFIKNIKTLLELNQSLTPQAKKSKNPIRKLAKSFKDKNIYLIGAEHLSANTHILTNQINESSKQLASFYKIPEFNHHFLEALVYPKKTIKQSLFVFIYSENYSAEIKKRFIATKKILDNKKITNLTIKPPSDNKLNEALNLLVIGSWLSFYLAINNNSNPADVFQVELFKKLIN